MSWFKPIDRSIHQVGVKSGVTSSLAILLLAVARYRDENEASEARQRPETLRQFVAVLTGNQPVRTASTIWRADASITAGVYITRHKSCAVSVDPVLGHTFDIPEKSLKS
jgi:hypothetical protein